MTRGVPFLWAGLLVVAVAAGGPLKYTWVASRTGNPNLLYNMALAVALCGGMLLADFAAAALRVDKVAAALARRRARTSGRVTCPGSGPSAPPGATAATAAWRADPTAG